MAVAVGVDAGTSTFDVFALKDGRPVFRRSIPTKEVRKHPESVLRAIEDARPDAIAGLSGYGLPVKRFCELTDRDIVLMTLNFDDVVVGLRKVVELVRDEFGKIAWTVPGVIHLPTVPEHRKINRIDMGTSDKLCSVALAMYQLKEMGIPVKKQNFVLVESGYGFNAFIAVKNGKVVDGIGGTSGFPSFSSLGSLDGELAYLLSNFPKSLLFKGGIRSLLKDMGIESDFDNLPRFAVEWLCEFLVKGIRAVSCSLEDYDVVVSGKFFDLYYEDFVDFSGIDAVKLEGFGIAKNSAEGAAIIADGLMGWNYGDIVDALEIRRARGSALDYITSDVREFLKTSMTFK